MHKKPGKRILLVEPVGNLPFYVLPLGLGYLKSNLSDRHFVKIFDCSIKGVLGNSDTFRDEVRQFKPDIVAVSASIQTYIEGLAAIETAKSIDSEITTVMGGPHPSLFAKHILQNKCVDYVFRGEAELSFSGFVDQVKEDENWDSIKGLVYRKRNQIIENDIHCAPDLDIINIPDYKDLRLDEYLRNNYSYGGFYGKSAPIWVTRGCPYACTFCSASLINGRKIRRHSIGYMIDWIDYLYKEFSIRQFAIIDDNFTFDMNYAKEFCRAIVRMRQGKHFREKIYFATPNGIRLDKIDDELLILMKEAGWQGVSIAPESGSRKTLKRMKKHIDPDSVPGIVKQIKAVGLNVRAFFLIGYPGETIEDLKDTIKLIRKCKLDAIILGRFLPIPGTPIFNELVKDGEISQDYMPLSIFKFVMPLSKKKEDDVYLPQGLKYLNSFWFFFRENVFLIFRNPYSIIYFCKYYGTLNLIKKFFLATKKIK
jgi:anaerobic magnesium-protoporphyrin IX monomethyl ester cyclase